MDIIERFMVPGVWRIRVMSELHMFEDINWKGESEVESRRVVGRDVKGRTRDGRRDIWGYDGRGGGRGEEDEWEDERGGFARAEV